MSVVQLVKPLQDVCTPVTEGPGMQSHSSSAFNKAVVDLDTGQI